VIGGCQRDHPESQPKYIKNEKNHGPIDDVIVPTRKTPHFNTTFDDRFLLIAITLLFVEWTCRGFVPLL